MRLWDDKAGHEIQVPMTATGPDLWEATITMPGSPDVFWYRFVAQDGAATATYQDGIARDEGLGQVWDPASDNDYPITIYDPALLLKPPHGWPMRSSIQYFPDRFNNGDPRNHPPSGEFMYGGQTTTLCRLGREADRRQLAFPAATCRA